ncbi:MAG: DUF2281 domain-containing protein [Saprospiraceae bacterium]
MITTEHIYRSILAEISTLSPFYLKEISKFVKRLSEKATAEKEANRNKIMELAGGWNDMSDDDFSEYLDAAKETELH